MLKKLIVRNFKSLHDVTVELPQLTVLLGSNAAGKSALAEAVQALSRIGNAAPLDEALGRQGPVRGYGFEAFAMPAGGIPALMRQESTQFCLEADLTAGQERYRYRIAPSIDMQSGRLRVADEYLARIGARGQPKGLPAIEKQDSQLHVRRKGRGGRGRPRNEPVGLNHALLSDRSLSSDAGFGWLEKVRTELSNWHTYYLEPRLAMRAEAAPADVWNIGAAGELLAPFLFKLKAEHSPKFEDIGRTLRAIVPSVENIAIDLNEQRGTLDLRIRQGGVDHSARVLSEGTLRVLALCAIAENPWSGSLLTVEEPENGVHPRRLELIAELLLSTAMQKRRQVIVTTHSPLFCDALLNLATPYGRDIGMYLVRYRNQATEVEPLDLQGPLLRDDKIRAALAADDTHVFGRLLLRGLIDA